MKQNKEGFSLVELVIAITVLAILTIPILAYFTNAAVSTSRGKDTQKANMAAQSVLEELNSCTSFEQIEEELKDDPEHLWQVDEVGPKQSKLTKTVEVDNTTYQAKVTVDFDYSTTNSDGDDVDSKYNDYPAPQLTEVYSPNSVVIAESDETETAVSNFYYQTYKTDNISVTKAQIREDMSRTLCLDVEKSGELYLVKGYYRYEYDGETYEAVLENTKIEASKLQNIYLFYDLLREDVLNENVEINITGIDLGIPDDEKINLFFVCQKGSFEKPDGYSLNVNGTNKNLLHYYSNDITVQGVTLAESKIVKHSTGKRIAAITVDVYDDRDGTTRLASLQTSKGV